MSQYGNEVKQIEKTVEQFQEDMNMCLMKFMNDTGIPVVLHIEDQQTETIGSKQQLMQVILARAVI